MEDGGWVSWLDRACRGATTDTFFSSSQNRYVCIEPGFVSEFKSIKPGEQFIGQQTISIA